MENPSVCTVIQYIVARGGILSPAVAVLSGPWWWWYSQPRCGGILSPAVEVLLDPWWYSQLCCGSILSPVVEVFLAPLWQYSLPLCGGILSPAVAVFLAPLWWYSQPRCGSIIRPVVVVFLALLWLYSQPRCGGILSPAVAVFLAPLWWYSQPLCGSIIRTVVVLLALLWKYSLTLGWYSEPRSGILKNEESDSYSFTWIRIRHFQNPAQTGKNLSYLIGSGPTICEAICLSVKHVSCYRQPPSTYTAGDSLHLEGGGEAQLLNSHTSCRRMIPGSNPVFVFLTLKP